MVETSQTLHSFFLTYTKTPPLLSILLPWGWGGGSFMSDIHV